MQTWSLRHELLNALQHWPYLVGSFLAGSLIGLIFILLRPSPYQAEQTIYVGINPYRAPLDTNVSAYANFEFTNVDDYKNWQLSQLNQLIFLDDFIQDTLTNLQSSGDAWANLSPAELRGMLEVNWRNAGRWSLTAEAASSELAIQLVQAWSQVIFEKTSAAVSSAQKTMLLELSLRENDAGLTSTQARQVAFNTLAEALSAWQLQSRQLPPTQVVSEAHYQRLDNMVSRAAGSEASWDSLIESFPGPQAPASGLVRFCEQVIGRIEQEQEILANQKLLLEESRSALAEEYATASLQSRGLSPSLVIEGLETQPPQVSPLRQTSTAILAGGFSGLLLWVLLISARLSIRVTQ